MFIYLFFTLSYVYYNVGVGKVLPWTISKGAIINRYDATNIHLFTVIGKLFVDFYKCNIVFP